MLERLDFSVPTVFRLTLTFVFVFFPKDLRLHQYPTTNGGMQNGSSVGICVCMFGADLYAQSELINKISASELSWKIIKGALLAG